VNAPIKAGDWYLVRQGDSVASVAVRSGHLPETIWEAPENRDLRASRENPHVLMPGDRLFVPPVQPKTVSVPTGKPQKLVVQRPEAKLRLRLEDQGRPRAHQPFVLAVDGVEQRGVTDGEGLLEREVPVLARRAQVTVGEGEGAARYTLLLRALDPVAEVTGAQARLLNLGYGGVPVDGVLGEETEAALRHFQRDAGLEVTGALDRPTQQKLVERHGS
jgi:hypothetical protein